MTKAINSTWTILISLPLFEDLEGRRALACGTVQSNRAGVPRDITDVHKEEIKALNRGQLLHLTTIEAVATQRELESCLFQLTN